MAKELNVYQRLKELQNMSPEEWKKFLDDAERSEEEDNRKLVEAVLERVGKHKKEKSS